MKHWLFTYRYRLILVLIPILLFITNWQPDRFLLGWDNFNSEFNPTIAIQQAINAGWSEFRSMGIPAGLAYATDLLRAVVVWILHLFLPITAIRPFYNLLLLGIGGQGIFTLLLFLGINPLSACIGAIYAMTSFGTIQIFSLPYEPFSSFFAFFPWALLIWMSTLQQWNRKNLLLFSGINVLLTSAFYVQTIFVVYAMLIGIASCIYSLQHKNHLRIIFQRILILSGCILLINAYWLFTQMYFLLTNVSTVQNAMQTLLGWRVPYFQNAAHSSLFDFFTQYGQYVEFNGIREKIFATWVSYLSHPMILLFRSWIAIIILIGIIEGTNAYKKIMLGLFILHAITLLPITPIIEQFNSLLRSIPVVDQIFRAPFSKFAMSQSIVFGYFFALGIESVSHRFSSIKYRPQIIITTALCSLTIMSLPILRGNFFAPQLQVSVPQEYFDLFEYFKTIEPTARIAALPESDIWGWNTYTWGYQGSGFLWHGIAQPIVSRSYDVWSKTSENEYLEIKDAIQRENITDMLRVYNKYGISYILYDNNLLIDAKSSQKTQKIYDLLSQAPSVQKAWQKKGITVFSINLNESIRPVKVGSDLPNIGPKITSTLQDNAYKTFDTYITDKTRQYDGFVPFLNFQQQTYDPKKQWAIQESFSEFIVSAPFPNQVFSLATPSATFTEEISMATPGGVIVNSLETEITQQDGYISFRFPKIRIDPINFTDPSDCTDNPIPLAGATNIQKNGSTTILSTSHGHVICFGYHYDNAPLRYAYLVLMDTKNYSGQPLMIYANDHTNKQTLFQHQLNERSMPPYVMPPGPKDGIGFSLTFQNTSYLRTSSINSYTSPQVYTFPYQAIETILRSSAFKGDTLQGVYSTADISVSHPNPAYYKIQLDGSRVTRLQAPERSDGGQEPGMTIILSQSYDKGWLAYDATNKRFLKNHVLVNNWANGWVLDNKTIRQEDNKKKDLIVSLSQSLTVYIFFWPQLLQFLGFALLPIPFLWACLPAQAGKMKN